MKIEYDSKFNLGDSVYFLKPYNELEWFCHPAHGEVVDINVGFSKDFDSELRCYCQYEILFDIDQHYNRGYTDSNISECDIFSSVEEFDNEMKTRSFYSDGVTFKY